MKKLVSARCFGLGTFEFFIVLQNQRIFVRILRLKLDKFLENLLRIYSRLNMILFSNSLYA